MQIERLTGQAATDQKIPQVTVQKVNAFYFARAQTRSDPTKSADATSGTDVVQPKCCALRNFTFPV